MIRSNSKLKMFFFIALMVGVCLLLSACEGMTDRGESAPANSIAGCWVCSIYGTTFDIANGLVNDALDAVIAVSQTILGLGLALFLLVRIGSMFVFVPESEMVKSLKEIGFTLLKAIMVVVLISNSDYFRWLVREVVIYPIGQCLLAISNAVLNAVPESGRYFGSVADITADTTGLIIDGEVRNFDADRSIFGDLGMQVQYIVARIYATLGAGFTIVRHMFVVGGLFAWILGAIMWWQIFNLIVVFPFAFAEAFLWVAFYVVFGPILLALWVFPKTKKYLTNFFPSQFLTPFLNVLFGCIVCVLMITLLGLCSELMLNGALRETSQEANTFVAESASAGSPNIIILAMLCYIMRKIAMEIGEFTEKFGGESSENSFFTLINKSWEKLKKAAVIVAAAVVTGGAGAVQALGQEAVKAAAKQALKQTAQAAKKGVAAAAGQEGGQEDSKAASGKQYDEKGGTNDEKKA